MEVGEPRLGEITVGGSPYLSCKRDQIKMRDYMDGLPYLSGVVSPTWGPPPPCKQSLRQSLYRFECAILSNSFLWQFEHTEFYHHLAIVKFLVKSSNSNFGWICFQHTRIAVASARWNFLLFLGLETVKKFQLANMTAIRVCCKLFHPLYNGQGVVLSQLADINRTLRKLCLNNKHNI